MSVAAPVHDGPKVVAAINVSLQAQSVAARPDPEAYLDSVRAATVATAGAHFRRPVLRTLTRFSWNAPRPVRWKP